ncbi:MAG: hypothetical protein EP330_16895 [Deltaproteobacteria bacterium]|nr:MAG: hypothetical protein EP330_16895 [Deltaproteobacteria bacterium]
MSVWKSVGRLFVIPDEEGQGGAPSGDVDLDKLLAETRAMAGDIPDDLPEASEAPPAAPPMPPPPTVVPEVDEGAPLADLYSEAGVPASPYTAEKLLKVMDGLAALAPNVRHAAIAAMDAAEDSWTIEDAVLDAQRKSDVLKSEAKRLTEVERAAEASAAAKTADAEKHLSEATETIRQQIAEMEQLLQAEAASVASLKADIAAELENTRQACRRRAQTLRSELDRLSIVVTSFASTSQD